MQKIKKVLETKKLTVTLKWRLVLASCVFQQINIVLSSILYKLN